MNFFTKLKFSSFLKITIFSIFLSLPGVFFLIKNPLLLFGIHNVAITNFGSSILISSSICFFYIFPFATQYFLNNFQNIKDTFIKLFNLKNIFNFCVNIYGMLALFLLSRQYRWGFIL